MVGFEREKEWALNPVALQIYPWSIFLTALLVVLFMDKNGSITFMC